MSLVSWLPWISRIVPFFVDGTLPAMIEEARTPTVFVYVLDLGVVVSLSLSSAWWLLTDRAWGHVLAGFALVKSATMGFALLSMTVFALRAGQDTEPALAAAFPLKRAARSRGRAASRSRRRRPVWSVMPDGTIMHVAAATEAGEQPLRTFDRGAARVTGAHRVRVRWTGRRLHCPAPRTRNVSASIHTLDGTTLAAHPVAWRGPCRTCREADGRLCARSRVPGNPRTPATGGRESAATPP